MTDAPDRSEELPAARRAADRLRRLAVLATDAADTLAADTGAYAERVIATLEAGGRILFCGNGGSAATVEHMATEYVVRFRRERRPLPALALTTGSAALTAAANDYGYDQVFVRPIQAFGRSGDLLVVHSTSGRSPNCLAAVRVAHELGLHTIALTGADGGQLAGLAERTIRVPSDETAAIQEIHLAIEHAVADHVDAHFAAETS